MHIHVLIRTLAPINFYAYILNTVRRYTNACQLELEADAVAGIGGFLPGPGKYRVKRGIAWELLRFPSHFTADLTGPFALVKLVKLWKFSYPFPAITGNHLGPTRSW